MGIETRPDGRKPLLWPRPMRLNFPMGIETSMART